MSDDDRGGDGARWKVATVSITTPDTEPTDPSSTQVTAPAAPAAHARLAGRRASLFDPLATRFAEGVELGRGGMGRVVEATDRVLDRPVAIKHSLATNDVDLARFEREVRITAQLQHPGIVPILDTGRDATGRPYYVMRKIDGVPLGERVGSRTPVEDRLALVPALLLAVDAAAYAHARGIVHRDIKPWNILLGPFGETLLIDWGLARELGDAIEAPTQGAALAATDPQLTRAGSPYGTPGFMAPEQARGEPADPRSDVYSLGATLYYVLGGKPPYAGIVGSAAVAKGAAGEPPDFTAIPPEVPADLVAITSKAMAAAPGDRYADAGALASDLRRFLAGQLVAARPYSTLERLARWVRRHRIATTVSAIAIVAIAIVVIVSVRRVIAERDEAQRAQRLAEERAEDMLVDRARSLVHGDPTSAVALLRNLPAGSPRWRIAREIVRAAVAGGVERASLGHTGPIRAIAAGEGGVATTSGDGTIRLHDLATGTSRVVAEADARTVAWLDDHTLVFDTVPSGSQPAELVQIDTGSGARTVMATGAFAAIAAIPGAVVAQERGAATLFRAAGVPEVLAASGIAAIAASAGRVVLISPDRIVVIDPDGTRRERPVAIAKKIFAVRIAPAGDRVAALVFGAVLEWDIAGGAPREWPRSTSANNGIAYAGDQLVTWSTDGSGFTVLAGNVAPRWMPADDPVAIAAFDDGAYFATKTGRLAYLDALGLVELPHRSVVLQTLAADATGARAYGGTTTGELLVLDATPVRPQRLASPGVSRLFALAPDRALVGTLLPQQAMNQPTALEVVNPATGARQPVGRLDNGPTAFLAGDAVIGVDLTRRLVRWAGGTAHVLAPSAFNVSTSDGLTAERSLYYSVEHEVFEVPLPDGQPRSVGRFPPRVAGATPALLLHPIAGGVAVQTLDRLEPFELRTSVITRDGTRDLATAGANVRVAGQTPDGTWWMTRSSMRALRLPPGQGPTEIATDLPVTMLLVRPGGRVWALGDTQLHVIAEAGAIERSFAVTGKHAWLIRDGMLERVPAAVEVLAPEAGVRRVFHLPIQAARDENLMATDDGRLVAALIRPGTPQSTLLLWRDPVPLEPTELPAYIARVTNAHLELGSDAVRWK